MAEFADNGSFVNIPLHLADETVQVKGKRRKNQKRLKEKRLQRNKKKKEEYRKLSKQERRSKFAKKISLKYDEDIGALRQKLDEVEQGYAKEKDISAYCWMKWKRESKLSVICARKSNIKTINRQNLLNESEQPLVLGQGCFGKCIKMTYRNMPVAVKQFQSFVTTSSVLWEAAVVNQFDHPGLPFLLGVNLSTTPLLLITQFHGVHGKCVTLSSAHKIPLLKMASNWAQVYLEIADAIDYVHKKGLLHNDIKGDNVIINENSSSNFHPILIDFGKCRKLKDAKMYKLSKEEQKIYLTKHWHIAPELVRGIQKQSTASDIYSFGVMLKNVKHKEFKEIVALCIDENPINRPNLHAVKEKLSSF